MRLPLAACEDCAARRRRARVYLWLSYMAGKEEDAILYHRDIRERERRAVDLEAFAEARRRCVERADEIAGPGFSDRSWSESLEAFWTPEGEKT